MGGIEASANCTSTAGPAILITCPTFCGIKISSQFVVSFWLLAFSDMVLLSVLGPRYLLRCCSANNLDNFHRNLRLADPVHGQRERVDHVSCVVGGRVHGGHSGGMLGGH